MKDATSGGVQSVKEWKDNLIKQDEIDRYLVDGKDFIDDDAIEAEIEKNRAASPERIRAIIKKAYDGIMDSADVAALLNVTDPDLKEKFSQRRVRSNTRYTTTAWSPLPRCTAAANALTAANTAVSAATMTQ